MRLDSKVCGVLIKNKDGRRIPDDEFVVFRPQDDAFWPTLEFYRQICADLGASAEQVAAVEALQERVRAWREAHPDRCKLPDVQPGELSTGEGEPAKDALGERLAGDPELREHAGRVLENWGVQHAEEILSEIFGRPR